MNRKSLTIFITTLIFLVSACESLDSQKSTFSASEKNSLLHSANVEKARGSITLLYNDSTLARRCADCFPQIGSGNEDFSIKIKCWKFESCLEIIPTLYDAIQPTNTETHQCGRSFVQLTINSVSYDNQEYQEDYSVDASGMCVSHSGERYKLDSPIFSILNSGSLSGL